MRTTWLRILALFLIALPLAISAQAQSLAEAARKAREKKAQTGKAARVYNNDTIGSTSGGISTVGTEPVAAADPDKPGDKDAKDKASAEDPNGEKAWRAKFADARKKLAEAEKELDLLQRELNLNQQQYYSDPSKALKEQFDRKEVNEQRKAIEDKRKEVQQLRQALTDLEEELRRAGGNSSWAR